MRAPRRAPWANEAWFDHYFRLMVNTRVPGSESGQSLEIGGEVRIVGERSVDRA